MRTKTLLLSAAALVAGIISSQAQSNVYSANIVGYASVVIAGNGQFTLIANPFDDGNGNQLTNILSSANLPQGSQVLTWDPVSGYTTTKRLAGGWNGSTNLPPGMGFFVRNGTVGGGAPAVTNTFVGSIVVPNGGSVTNTMVVGYTLQASPIPFSGNIAVNGTAGGDTNLDFGTPLSAGAQILTWDPTLGYTTTKKIGGLWNATVTVTPGQGFFINNKNGPTASAVETLNLQ
jgi:hypothetical protein